MAVKKSFYKLFWIYVICGVAGYCIETVWCWIDFHEFTSRTSNLFFPISCVWGLGGILLYLVTVKNRSGNLLYIFGKCTILGAVFEFLCGYLGEVLFGVTFWDYSGVPLHIGKYINLPFCLVWGLIGVLWVWKIYPVLNRKLEQEGKKTARPLVNLFLVFMICSQVLTGTALFRMRERQNGQEPANYVERVLDRYFTDQTLQAFFPKMKSTSTGEKIYVSSRLP